eukprot:CAMPEP_0179235648 /NCGR_PEP_ID=MMETSP0797-20121207/13520_1 /TAXON_ID=47934 /ORGANISM="Dinophysis acuminata, Strain DAEP01" /LENGTH=95 /DNA_ID=CAMNT_0020942879 /DNA_START=48 /DNA_END=332 /DNA_ORIENTATION=+
MASICARAASQWGMWSRGAAVAAPLAGALYCSSTFQRSPNAAPGAKCEMKGYTGRFGGTEKAQADARGTLESSALEATAGKSAARWSIHSERLEG